MIGGTFTHIILALHATDEPVGGCRCRLRGPSIKCPAYREAERHHADRAQQIADYLAGVGLLSSPRSGSPEDLLTVSEAEEATGINPKRLYELSYHQHAGLTATKVGGRVYFRRSDLEKVTAERSAL